MTDEAVTVILQASAPGYMESVVDAISTLAPKSFSKNTSQGYAKLKAQQTEFQCLATAKQKSASPNHPLVGPLTTHLEQYQQNNFSGKQGMTSRFLLSIGDKDEQLVIHTYVEKADAPNHVSGYWRATWTIDNATADCADISGNIKVHSYAYEEGNAQVKLDKQFPTQHVTKMALKTGDEATVAQAIMKQITKWESEMLGILFSMNEGGNGEHLKSIRRVLPITKTKMKWDVVAQRSVKTLKKTAPQAKSKVNYGS